MDSTSASRAGLGGLSKQKTELLKLLLEKKSRQAQTIKPYPRAAGENRLPTSWPQQRLWLIDQLGGGSAGYKIPVAVRLRGELDQQALQAALVALVKRHEILRTVFISEAGTPQQCVLPQARFDLKWVDLTGHEAAEREAAVRLHEVAETHEEFKLRTGPLIRGRLLKLQPAEHVLLITLHHIVADGWSRSVLLRELEGLYTAYVEGRDDPLEPLPIQYGDYSQWQRQWLRAAEFDEQLKYWRSRLQGAAPFIDLPTDRPRPAAPSYRGENVAIVLDSVLTTKVRALAREHDMTLFMVLYAAWAILLSRLSGQEDVVVGTPVANRQRPELENLIGFFVNTLALRVAVEPEVSVKEFLAQVKEVARGAYDHQDVPFEKVVEAVQPARSLSRSPLFQSMFVLRNVPEMKLSLPGITATEEEVVDEPAILDLWMFLEERGDAIVGSANYAGDLFDRSTIQRWMEYYRVLLQEITEGTDRRVADLSILPPSERRLVLEQFNQTHAEYPRDRAIHELFEEQVRRTPDAIAVISEDRRLTYAQLNAAANQLAHYLVEQGARPGQFIPIVMPRCATMLIAQLATLKCGCVYVPLDPDLPTERLQFVLDDCDARRILSDRGPDERLAQQSLQWINYVASATSIASLPKHDLRLHMDSLSPAYVMYTSGSTGIPKGVVVPQHAVNRMVINASYVDVSADDCIAHSSNPAFDASTFEIWAALLNGARTLIVPQFLVLDAEQYAKKLKDENVTILWITIGLLTQYTEALTSVFPRLKCLITGGDVVDPVVIARIMRNPPQRLLNAYGPTECTTFSTTFPVEPRDVETQSLPIGRPISNAQIYILDRSFQPVPIGVVGELYIGGEGVALGYLKRPEQTTARFTPDPFSSQPGARLYRTGDLGRWRASGDIEFMGRNDRQVKIRGFRIEPGEIESRLSSLDQVRESAVVALTSASGEKRLVAYVTLREPGEDCVERIRASLRESLPEYMVPSALVVLDKLPLTQNGKLDRAALPSPDSSAYGGRVYEEPRGEMEQTLATLWREVLRIERVGRHDNFFELGGHSLLIVQMMERLRKQGLAIDVRSVFERPTLADLASAITAAERFLVPPNAIPDQCSAITPAMLPLVQLTENDIERIVAAVPGGAANVQDIYPLAPLQEGMLFHHLLKGSGSDAYARSKLLSFASGEAMSAFVGALQKMVDRHDVLRTAVLWEQLSQPVQVVFRHATLPVKQIALEAGSEPVEQLKQWMLPGRLPLDLGNAPLLHLYVASGNTDGGCHAVLQTHHLIFDGESLHAMLAEVGALMAGRERELPESVPYRDHVAFALSRSQAQSYEAFFREKLGDVEEPTAPFGLLDVQGDGSVVHEEILALSPKVSERLRAQARHLNVSAATLFHAAWSLVVARTSGKDDVVFGTVLLGRLHGGAEAQRALGMFINTLPMRLRLSGISARDLVTRVHRELAELVSHEQAPLAGVQRCSGITGSAPLFSAVLSYRRSSADADAELARGAGVSIVRSSGGTNYPVMLSVIDQGDDFVLDMETDNRIDALQMVRCIAVAVESLVDALESAPKTTALSLEVLPEQERRQILERFNPSANYASGALIHELFEAQATRRPNAVAVIFEDQSLTYAELNARANRLARYLIAKGIRPDDLVGICVERGLDMTVALLGVLKSGGGYLPLDPAYPAERLAFALKDARPKVVLTQESQRDKVSPTAAEVIALDSDWSAIEREHGDNLDARAIGASARNLAYVIYTSGSTGKPKGVMVEHRHVVRLFAATQEWFHFDARDVWTLFHSYAFDFSVWELWGALFYGGKVVIVPSATARSPQDFYELLCKRGVTVLNQTPSAFTQLIEAQAGSTEKHALRVVVFGGEALELRSLRPWISRNPIDAPQLVNMYGITETTVHVTYRRLSVDDIMSGRNSVIGTPIPDLRVYVLSRERQPVPVGVVGEIYVGGAGASRGYLNRPELTAERFVADPFSAEPGARLYKTGDLARWRADGGLEYLGRNDHQVKIRGFRIELGEIEAQLAKHEPVKEVVVHVREDAPGEKRLVAYIVPREATEVSADSLRTHLRTNLPEHMVPSAFVTMRVLPLTPSGKLDRRALPPPKLDAYTGETYEAPINDVERGVAQIWSELLGVERVGRHDNFFELGGHSLHGIKLIGKVAERFALQISAIAMFQHPTVQQFAEFVASLLGPESLDTDPDELEAGVI